tara:strand:+ start:3423 stop:4424 length:1002 start_codon:yes stop_codon:yes gene_type:complete
MPLLLNGDCLEEMKQIDDNSVDLIFCDLPYGQTSCKWDCKIDLDKFWIEIMRIKKTNTPLFFTTTTKFGVDLIKSAPKKCPFRYDLVWVKSAPAGFLSAKKMPMRKHEMLYVFYEKLPLYDLSSHKHKFIKEVPTKRAGKDNVDNKGMIKNRSKSGMETITKYDPPLPTSVVKEEKTQISKAQEKHLYGASKGGTIGNIHGTNYNPPLPTSVVKQEPEPEPQENYETCDKPERKTMYGNMEIYEPKRNGEPRYNPPLPTTMLEIKSTRGKHSTEKPVALMEWILKYYSKEGDVVLDPTMGSGSTGVACKNMNREFIGIEMDGDIYESACKRLE